MASQQEEEIDVLQLGLWSVPSLNTNIACFRPDKEKVVNNICSSQLTAVKRGFSMDPWVGKGGTVVCLE